MDWKTGALILSVGMLTLPATPVLAQNDDRTVRLAPSMPWNLDFSEDSCALRRIFGEEGREVYFELRQYAPGGDLQLSVLTDDIPRRPRDARITFMPDHSPIERERWFPVESENFGEGMLTTIDLSSAYTRYMREQADEENPFEPPSDAERDAREAEIEAFRIEGAFRYPIELQTGSFSNAMNGMRSCMDELLAHWGIDVEAHRTLTRKVAPLDQAVWVQEFYPHYPSDMARRGEQAYIRARINVSAEGRATACNVQSQLNDETFNTLACELLLEHSRFEPALDASGDPIASYHTMSIIYSLE